MCRLRHGELTYTTKTSVKNFMLTTETRFAYAKYAKTELDLDTNYTEPKRKPKET